MKFTDIQRQARSFLISWPDGSQSEAPFIWLRDNDQNELHPQTGERTFDLTSVALDIEPDDFRVDSSHSKLVIYWPSKTEPSHYSAKWLSEHRPGKAFYDPAKIERKSWAAKEMQSLPRFDAKQCHSHTTRLLEALTMLKQTGIVLIENLDDDPAAGERFGNLLGNKRETNFGVVFEVKSKPEPNNLAYTSLALPLHTDLSNQEFVPGNQFLHCCRNDAIGGGSVFTDAMAIVEDFKRDCPEFYKTLCETNVPWRFHDERDDIRYRRPVIGLTHEGQFNTLTFNAHIADIPDFDTDLMYSFYAAYRELMQRIRGATYNIEYVLKSGEMVIFDNQRVMHGRNAFDPTTGERHLRGYYIEHNEINSRIRMLDQQIAK